MNLTLKERIVIPQLYPKSSSLTGQIFMRDINKKIEVTQDEIKEFEIKENKGAIQWNPEKAKEKKVDFTEGELSFLQEQIKRLDKEEKITAELLDVCVKINKA